eukprot:scaffold652_cov260-Pinguiococcus_pyrenoidosus.AAC.10
MDELAEAPDVQLIVHRRTVGHDAQRRCSHGMCSRMQVLTPRALGRVAFQPPFNAASQEQLGVGMQAPHLVAQARLVLLRMGKEEAEIRKQQHVKRRIAADLGHPRLGLTGAKRLVQRGLDGVHPIRGKLAPMMQRQAEEEVLEHVEHDRRISTRLELGLRRRRNAQASQVELRVAGPDSCIHGVVAREKKLRSPGQHRAAERELDRMVLLLDHREERAAVLLRVWLKQAIHRLAVPRQLLRHALQQSRLRARSAKTDRALTHQGGRNRGAAEVWGGAGLQPAIRGKRRRWLLGTQNALQNQQVQAVEPPASARILRICHADFKADEAPQLFARLCDATAVISLQKLLQVTFPSVHAEL